MDTRVESPWLHAIGKTANTFVVNIYTQDNSVQYDVDVFLYSPYYVTTYYNTICTVVRRKK